MFWLMQFIFLFVYLFICALWKEIDNYECLDVDGKIILKRVLEE
jgi:hypothetical protein